jgi:hypothetical protein
MQKMKKSIKNTKIKTQSNSKDNVIKYEKEYEKQCEN